MGVISKAKGVYKRYGFAGFCNKLSEKLQSPTRDYHKNRKKYLPSEEELEAQRKSGASFSYCPKISVVVPAFETKEQFLRDLVSSLLEQTYENWELCIADGSRTDAVSSVLAAMREENSGEKYNVENHDGRNCDSEKTNDERNHDEKDDSENCGGGKGAWDARIRYKHLEKNGGISENTNGGLEMVTGDYIGFMDHDDVLSPNALFEVVKAINCYKDGTGVKSVTSSIKEKEETTEEVTEKVTEKAADNRNVVQNAGQIEKKEKKYPQLLYSDEDKVSADLRRYTQPHFKSDFNLELLRTNNYICHFTVVSKELLQKVGGFRKEYDGSQDYDFILRAIEQTKEICHIPKILYHWRMHEASTAGDSDSKEYTFDAGKRAIEAHLERCGIPATVEKRIEVGCYHVIYEREGARDNRHEQGKEVRVLCFDEQTDIDELNALIRTSFAPYVALVSPNLRIRETDWQEEMLSYFVQKDVGVVGGKVYSKDGKVDQNGLF